MRNNATYCSYSLEDLNAFRDKDGFINLNNILSNITHNSQELTGNPNRFKYWINFNGTHALIKENIKIDDIDNGCVYAELISEELMKQLGIKSAHCDLITYNGFKGILSQDILSPNEELFSIDSIIGPITTFSNVPDLIDLIEVQKKVIEALYKEGYSKKEIQNVILDFQKRIIVDIFTISTDDHLENIGIVQSYDPNTHKKKVTLSPSYDRENSLLLDNNLSLIATLCFSKKLIHETSQNITPKISLLSSDKSQGLYTNILINTINSLIAIDDIYDFACDCYEKLNIELAIENVEKRINASIPETIRRLAINAFECRKNFFNNVLCLELSSGMDNPPYIDPNDLDL